MDGFALTRHDRRQPKLVLEQAEVAQLLAVAALALSAVECPNDAEGDCEGCNEFRKLFWSLSNALDYLERAWYQAMLARNGIPLPDGPWEEVNPDGSPKE